ncbi:hypothetical protein BBJ28_00022074 [Nothophytophthora sp. Chile5]|nr:hypothetical protein BBJ28_00022074 [Nothophytophthora sp. Chile5]
MEALRGPTAVGDEKQLQIEQEVACHLGELKRGFEAGTIDENTTENIDKTHFVIDFDNVSTLEYSGEKKMKYADAVSGGEGMVVVVRISGGSSRYIHPPMTIFTNIHGSYPIRGVVDSVEGGCYRAGPKQGGWIGVCFANTLQRGELWWRIGGDVRRQYFGGNCSGHLDEDEYYDGLYQLKAQLRFLPANTTDLGQPADSFVIVKTKDVLAHRWNENRLERIENNA